MTKCSQFDKKVSDSIFELGVMKDLVELSVC